jgi:hypothetical protein
VISGLKDGPRFTRFGQAVRRILSRVFEEMKGEGVAADSGALRGLIGRSRIFFARCFARSAQLGPAPRCACVRAQKRENLRPLQSFESFLRDAEGQFRIPGGKLDQECARL